MEYTTQEDLNYFRSIYMMKYEFENNMFENMWANYYNLVIEYRANLMEKKVEELSVVFENL